MHINSSSFKASWRAAIQELATVHLAVRIASFQLAKYFSVVVFFYAIHNSHATVFRGRHLAPEDQLNNGSLPWDHAYKANMTVNGRKSVLQLYSARWNEPAALQLKNKFEALGAEVKFSNSLGSAGVAKWPDREARFFILKFDDQPLQQIFVYYPDPKQKKQRVKFPIPQFPNGTIKTTINDDDNHVFMATILTSSSSTEVHSFYSDEMASDGWTLAMPATSDNGEISGMATYVKGKKVCYVQAKDKLGKKGVITLLVKEGTL